MTFFETDEDKKEEGQEPEKIKVGESEFSKEELDALIGSGRKLKEIEEKQGQPIDEILTSWGKRGERIGEYKKKTETLERELEGLRNPPPKEEIDRQKIREQVLTEARELGLLTKEEYEKDRLEFYRTQRSGERMAARVKRVIREAKTEGKPAVTFTKLLEFMADPDNPKDPDKAYKLMFEKELDDWKTQQLAKIKQGGNMISMDTKSTAGSKEFTPPKVTRENLTSVLRDYVQSGGGQ